MRRRLPPWRGIEAFEAVAAAGTVTAAAARLHLSESAVSRQIRAVEIDLGTPLLLRLPSGLVLTAAGADLLPVVVHALDSLESATERLRIRPRAPRLTVGCDPALAERWLIPLLAAAPPPRAVVVELTSLDTGSGRAVPHLRIAWQDVGQEAPTSTLPLPDAFGPVHRPLAAESARPWAGTTRIHARSWPDAWERWDRVAGGIADGPAGEVFMADLALAVRGAEVGLGRAIVPEALVRPELADGRLIAPSGFRPLGRRVAIVPSDNAIMPAALVPVCRDFIAWLRLGA
ncbi:LysR family transcriptional regulator [uncultured Methylobacterium sp.]|uniref:LysR family transcriptional regulator n=1 Tax=uncultured Methylobacterium sp. TaxID=157278 RepID=UPI00258E7B23|nr:LysR family transcriptional regulator [uncultured Methylobacterium sp.]